MDVKGFSLDQFKKEKDQNSKTNEYPFWLDKKNEMLVSFYDRATLEFDLIKAKIELDIGLNVKERQIVKSSITSHCGYDKSNLRRGRPAEKVSDYIDELNEDLKRIWARRNPIKRKNPEKLLRSELEAQNKALKKQCKELETASYRDYFDQWIEAYSFKESQRMRARIIDIELQNQKLYEANLILEGRIREINRGKLAVVESD